MVAPVASGSVKVIHAAKDDILDVAGASVASVRASLWDVFNLYAEVIPFINGEPVPPSYRLQRNDTLEFIFPLGHKSVGERVWTADELCQFFKITSDDLQAWIAQGLKVKRCLDGSIRITETAVDEFNRGKVVQTPYLTIEEAAKHIEVHLSCGSALRSFGKCGLELESLSLAPL